MKILQIIREEIVPLSKKKNIVLLTIIACIFQFTLFYAPALADEAVSKTNAKNNSQKIEIINEIIEKTIINDEPIVTQDIAKPLATSSEKIIRTSTHTMTAYNSEVGQTDDSPCITANGFNVCKHGIEDTIAANFLPMGTKVKIPDLFGERIFIVRDRMNKKHPNRVDVWMKDRHDALQFGVRVAKIQVLD